MEEIILKIWKETLPIFKDNLRIEHKDNFYRLHFSSFDDGSDADEMVDLKFKPTLEEALNIKVNLIKFAFEDEKPYGDQIGVNHNFDDEEIEYYNTIDINLNK
jgi:hypothetical protein